MRQRLSRGALMLLAAALLGVICGCEANIEPRWAWHEVSDALCANGTATGVMLDDTVASTDLLIFISGGGACWDGVTCSPLVGTASNLGGYHRETFATDVQRQSVLLSRTAENPFQSAALAFVPYCTGDLHSGRAETSYGAGAPTHHVGARTLEALVRELATRVPAAKRVFVVGVSAGGFGAQLQLPMVRRTFPTAELHVLIDSAPLVTPSQSRLEEWHRAWAFSTPTECEGCEDDLLRWAAYDRGVLGDGKLAVISSEADGLLSSFTALDSATMRERTDAYLRAVDHPNTSTFVLSGSQHTVLLDPLEPTVSREGASLTSFVRRWAQ